MFTSFDCNKILSNMIYSTKIKDTNNYFIKFLHIQFFNEENNIITDFSWNLTDLFESNKLNEYFIGKFKLKNPEHNCIIVNFYNFNNLSVEEIELLKRICLGYSDVKDYDGNNKELLISKEYLYLYNNCYIPTLKGYYVLSSEYPLIEIPRKFNENNLSEFQERFLSLMMIREDYGWREEI